MVRDIEMPPRQLSRRQLLVTGTMAAALGDGGMLAIGARWSRAMAQSRITVLGSGGEPSLLFTAGAARVLVVAGNAPADFADALAGSRYLTTRRVDILLLLPSAMSGGVAAKAVEIARGLDTWRIGDQALTAKTAHLGVFPVLPSPRRIRLPDDIVVRVETKSSPAAAPASSPKPVSQITISRGRTAVVAIFGSEARGTFAPPGPVSAVICPEAAANDISQRWRPRALIVTANEKQRIADARGFARRFRVPNGETLQLDFQADGLRLTGQPPETRT